MKKTQRFFGLQQVDSEVRSQQNTKTTGTKKLEEKRREMSDAEVLEKSEKAEKSEKKDKKKDKKKSKKGKKGKSKEIATTVTADIQPDARLLRQFEEGVSFGLRVSF